jgi:hypothetical protein
MESDVAFVIWGVVGNVCCRGSDAGGLRGGYSNVRSKQIAD